MKWSYDVMYKWYTKQGKIRDSLYEIIYPVIYDAKRPNKKNQTQVEPFIKRNIIYVGESPLQDYTLFPNGLYLLYDDNGDTKKWLYFVYPTQKECSAGKTVMFADHLSFCQDKSDKKNPCHFHSTTYDCAADNDYTFRHVKDYFSDQLNEINDSSTDIIKHPFHRQKRSCILSIMQLPWHQIQVGSGNKKKRKESKPKHRPISNEKFCTFWNENRIKHTCMIGIRNNDIIIFSIAIYKKGRTNNNELYTSFVFQCHKDSDYESLLQEYLHQQVI